ncbi:4Fe-4S binding protein [Azohydromonas australica]|uniref:4Fe-4S binding protein n=1 Tax=Azohydromonas australica TaxID=364039 RepID=UPI00041B6BDE|nr:4Fe-4S binding protein [Azohydromonas australica]
MTGHHPTNTCPAFKCGTWQIAALALLMALASWCPLSWAGILDKSEIERRFSHPYRVEEKLSNVPVWPVTSPLEQNLGPALYVFESIDIAPLPGFEGNPMNFLIAIDRKGNFVDVELLQQREPVFTFRDLGGQKDRPLKEFIAQYPGHSISDQYLIAQDAARNKNGGPARSHAGQTTLDGVAKATTSIRIINQTVLTAALEVARARLGFANHQQAGPPAQVRSDAFEAASFDALVRNGSIGHLRLTHAEAEKLFAGTEGEGSDTYGISHPEETFVELYVAYLNVPTIGHAVLGREQYEQVMARNFDHQHLWWVGTRGRFVLADEDFLPGAQSSRLAMAQDGMFLEFRDQGLEPRQAGGLKDLNSSRLFGVNADAHLDPARPAEFRLTFSRSRGTVLSAITHQSATLAHSPPARYFSYPPKPWPEWLLAWQARAVDIGVLLAAFSLLSLVLARPRWWSVSARRLALFRRGFLAFTLIYVGWHAQGQLSVVQITGLIKALMGGHGLSNFLYDPISLVLMAFTGITFFLWGRGAFCGWLCPFGALQEFVGLLAQRLRIPQLDLPPRLARRLGWSRYAVLATLVVAAFLFPTLGETLNEVEPFKTTITLGFDRPWPFVAYAVALLLLAAAYYKFFCRVLCPLGGAMSLGGKLRRLNWLPRRAECGKPCQRCKTACRYDAIEPSGAVRWDDCFQCLDCVGIYHDAQRCVPVIVHHRTGRHLAGQAAATRAAGPSPHANASEQPTPTC